MFHNRRIAAAVATVAVCSKPAKAHLYPTVPAVYQLECEVAVNTMLKKLMEDMDRCRPKEDEAEPCRVETARDAHILYESGRTLAKGRLHLSWFDQVHLAALKTSLRVRPLFDFLHPDFDENVQWEIRRFQVNHDPSPQELETATQFLWNDK